MPAWLIMFVMELLNAFHRTAHCQWEYSTIPAILAGGHHVILQGFFWMCG